MGVMSGVVAGRSCGLAAFWNRFLWSGLLAGWFGSSLCLDSPDRPTDPFMPPPAPILPTGPISRITRVRDYRAFRDFTWPGALLEFRRFNLVYGWNGSGKTTLANLFAHLARRQNLPEGIAEFELEGRTVGSDAFATAAGLPEIRVFNRDFVAASVFSNETPLGPIYYFGQANVEKQKELDALKAEIAAAEAHTAKAQEDTGTAERRLEEYCVQQAKVIKDMLTAPGSGPYNNYNKADFKRRCDAMGADPAAHRLTDASKSALKQQKDALPKPAIALQAVEVPDLEVARQSAAARLATTVVSQALEHLVNHPHIAAWVRQGLPLHSATSEKLACEFCRNPLTAARVAELEGHFNDQYETFFRDLDAERTALEAAATAIEEQTFPASAELFDHLSTDYETARAELLAALVPVTEYLRALAAALAGKRDKPFERLALEPVLGEKAAGVGAPAKDKRAALDRLVTDHNEHCANLPKNISAARKQLEAGWVAEAHPDYTVLKANLTEATTRAAAGQAQLAALRPKAAEVEGSLVEHLKPAAELNGELAAFLGRGDLVFEAKETGYVIKRGIHAAANLSEGEKTAIAFLYFLKSLRDRSFALAQGVVVIDDPVSSLDANSLFCAFGCMREATHECAQLFVLTHNFGFFRQVKNWFHHLPGQKKEDQAKHPARFYMVSAPASPAGRNIILAPLDRLLHEFESEYQFLFSRVHAEANRAAPAAQLEEYYPLPNLARRLLESFLAFRYPDVQGHLEQKLTKVAFDEAKKTRILRFLHTYSHGDRIEDPGHDLTILAETPQVLLELLQLMAAEDERHYAAMLAMVAPDPAAP